MQTPSECDESSSSSSSHENMIYGINIHGTVDAQSPLRLLQPTLFCSENEIKFIRKCLRRLGLSAGETDHYTNRILIRFVCICTEFKFKTFSVRASDKSACSNLGTCDQNVSIPRFKTIEYINKESLMHGTSGKSRFDAFINEALNLIRAFMLQHLCVHSNKSSRRNSFVDSDNLHILNDSKTLPSVTFTMLHGSTR